jgi:hypothetical protein
MKRLLLLLLLLVFSFTLIHAQSIIVDPTFNPADYGHGNCDGADDAVMTTTVQPDG